MRGISGAGVCESKVKRYTHELDFLWGEYNSARLAH